MAEGPLARSIAAGERGVGVLPLGPLLAGDGAPREVALDELRFVPVAAGAVVRVVPVDERSVLAVVGPDRPSGRGLDSVLVRMG